MSQPKLKKRKRSAPTKQDDDTEEIAPKIVKENAVLVISEIEFKFFLSDRSTVSEGLEKFISSAEAVTTGQPCSDIVALYCRSSQTCSELFALIDPGSTSLKMNEMALVFRCLELILSRIRTDLLKYASTGEAIVQKMLAGHMGQVYNCLQEQNKSKTIKACLQLLIAMVCVSERAKKAVQSRLNFGHVCFPSLFRRRNRKDPKDVRSCAVLLTLAFLLDSDLNTIKMLVQQKSFLQLTLAGLKYDRTDLVLDVLSTLLDKVVTFSGLTKTDKVKLFSEAVLKQLCELYDWQGPSGWVPSKKKRQKDDEVRAIPEGFTEDLETVASVTHEFLLELCCSHKHGLNFYDKTVGTGQRNHNQLLAHLIDWLIKKISERRRSQLVIGILCACPDLIKATLTKLCPSLNPRWSDKWRELVVWVTNLYRKLPDIPPFLASQDYLKDNHVTVISMATVFCLPPSSVAAVFAQGFRHEDMRVRDKCARLIQVLAKKACAIRSKLALDISTTTKVLSPTTTRVVSSTYDDSFLDAFSASVLKTLPPTSQLFVCVDKTMQMMSTRHQKVSEQGTPLTTEEMSSVDLSRHASVLLQVLGLYQTLTPLLLSERPKDLAKLIDMVGCLQSHSEREKTGKDDNRMEIQVEGADAKSDGVVDNVQGWLPQLYLLKLLSDTDARKISLGREGLMEKLLLSASENQQFRSLTIGLVCQMLESMEIFSKHVKELRLWLELAMESETDRNDQKPRKINPLSSPSVTFLARCLATLINNPSPYVDRIMEAMAETSRSSVNRDQNNDPAHSATSDSAIDAILAMDDKELDKKLDTCQPQVSSQHSDIIHLPFSPLTLVTLDNLQHLKSAGDVEKEYVSRVLVRLLHSLPDPIVLARIVTKSEAMASLCEGVPSYLQYWAGDKIRSSVTQTLPAAKFGILPSALMCRHFGLKNAGCTVAELSSQMGNLSSQEKLTALKQILLYVADVMQTQNQKKKCEETINNYIQLATSLCDHLYEEENQRSEDSSWMKLLLGTSKNVENDDVLMDGNSSADDMAVFEVLFSRIVLTASESVVVDSFRCVLLNSTLKTLLFTTIDETPKPSPKKSPKGNNRCVPAVSICEQVSQFVSYIITRSSSCSWLRSEMDLVDQYVNILLDGLVNERLPSRLEEICSNSLQSVSSLLDLTSLSRCVTRLLQTPISSLVDKRPDGSKIVNKSGGTLTYQTLCELLKHLKVLIENHPRFVNSLQLTKLLHPTNAGMCTKSRDSVCVQESYATKACIQIRSTFNFEVSTGQQVSTFSHVFDLLPVCKNQHLSEFAIFMLSCLPEMVPLFTPKLFDELFKNPLTLLENSQEERLFVSIVTNVKECFLLFEEWLTKHLHTIIKREKWFFIITYLEANVCFSGGYTKTVEAIKQTASSSILQLGPVTFGESLPCLKLVSLAVQGNDSTFQQLLVDKIISQIREGKNCQLIHFTVLQIAVGFCMGLLGPGQAGQSLYNLVIDVLVKYLASLFDSGNLELTSLEEYILEMASNLINKLACSDWKWLLPSWEHMFRSAVRHRLTKAKHVRFVASLTEIVLSGNTHAAIGVLFELCVGHPMFHTVLTAVEHAETKVELVKLVHILGELDKSCYSQTQLSSQLVSAYSASLSVTDQRLLLMMQRCSHASGLKFECPTLWGASAIEHQTVAEVLGPSLHKQVSSQTILEQLNSELMQNSILHFPVRRFHTSDIIVDASDFKSRPNCYDPAFLLRLFVQILSPDKQVVLRLFVERDCLSYLMIALSSHDPHIRLLAYHALNDFYLHVEGSRWHDKIEMTFVLDLLNASRVKDGQKLSFVVALFFARTVKLLLYPADPMYVPIFRFLVAKPEVDLGNVPEFYQLFFSAGNQYKHERNWMLSLLYEGMRETSDYWLYQKKFIFKILLSYYDSAISDAHSQKLILLMVKNACQEKSVAVDLVKNHGLMPWLAAAVTTVEKRLEQTDLLCDIIHTLWFSLTASKYLTQSNTPGSKSGTSDELVLSKTDAVESMDIESETKVENDSGNSGNKNHRVGRQKVTTDDGITRDDGLATDDGKKSDADDGDLKSPMLSSADMKQVAAKASGVSVPRSTFVEMALISKSLIWHLSNSSVDGLLKVLQLLHGMISSETSNTQLSHSDSSMDTSHPDHNESKPQFQNLLNLSPIESCLLLYHVAVAVQQPVTADIAASVLKSKSVDVAQLCSKRASKGINSIVKEDNSQLSLPADIAEPDEQKIKEPVESTKQSMEDEAKNAQIKIKNIVNDDEKRQLFQLVQDIVQSSRTLQLI